MDDPYLKARYEDIRHLGNKLYHVWLSKRENLALAVAEEEDVVLIGEALCISDIANLPSGRLKGVVCFDGSSLSRISILANALGIPSVMGTGEILDIHAGETIIVDGDNGHVIMNPSQSILKEYQELSESGRNLDRSLQAIRHLPAITTDGIQIRLFANTGLQEDLLPGLANGAEGIGLYRTEIPFMVRQSLPSEMEQIEFYKKVFESYQNKPVYVRTLDIGADKPLPYLPVITEENPAPGLRGIRFTLDHIQLLVTQVRAILRAANGRLDVHMLIPMVSASAELNRVLVVVDDAISQLRAEGHAVIRPKIGVMVEVPAVISFRTLNAI